MFGLKVLLSMTAKANFQLLRLYSKEDVALLRTLPPRQFLSHSAEPVMIKIEIEKNLI